MMWLEYLVWLIPIAAVAYAAAMRFELRLPRRAAREISPEVRAELDVTPEWWDKEFRKLSGEPEPSGGWTPLGDQKHGLFTLLYNRLDQVREPEPEPEPECPNCDYVDMRTYADECVRPIRTRPCFECSLDMGPVIDEDVFVKVLA